jgi:DNA polymerase I-like protein with 3'-5' exonuclease and polymerase domains
MIYLDIETNMKHNEIWLCVTKKDNEVLHWRSPTGLQKYIGNEQVCAHNGIGFDYPILRQVWNVQIRKSQAVDTLIMSRLHNPVIEGGHSLKAWGKRLGFEKMDFDITDFDAGWTQEMADYCERDVEVLSRLHKHLESEFSAWLDNGRKPLEMEHEVAIILSRMERTGFSIDKAKAEQMEDNLISEMDSITHQLQEVFPPIIEERWSEKTGKRLKDKVVIFNPASRKQIAERLEALGVDFDKHTEKGNVIIDDVVLNSIDLPEAKLLARYFWLQKRHGLVTSWLKATKEDGRVHGRINSLGAVTNRCTHSSPNMGQIPSDHDCRELWNVGSNRSLVGSDLSGIELRCLAHYMRDDNYTKELLEGDIHTANQEAAGLPTRSDAKTFIYAFLYGAGEAKLGSIVGGSSKEGAILKQRFFRKIPSMKRFIDKVKKLSAKGYVPALDGRRIQVKSEHSSPNMLLQSAGAIVAKQWLIESQRQVVKQGLDAKLVAFVHDETQWDCATKDAEKLAQLLVDAAETAGKQLGFRLPVAAESAIGKTWADTH